MNITVLSGKGGTGKTTISTNLSSILQANYFDCDVEEPNGFLFLDPNNIETKNVEVEIPEIDKDKCNMCGKCVKTCKFNALAKTKKDIIVFDKLCHSCGACEIVCPTGALKYVDRKIGVIEEGRKNNSIYKRGLLDIGEPMAVPILKDLLNSLPEGLNILDSSPGTSCNVVKTLNYTDKAVLVTEPTLFGLTDLKRAVELVKNMDIPLGIVINKYDKDNKILDEYIKEQNLNVLGYIPYTKKAAIHYSKGKLLIDIPEYKEAFINIAENIKERLL